MAEPARRGEAVVPLVDPTAVERAYRLERARRRARLQRDRARRLQSLRFAVSLVVLLAIAIAVALTSWAQFQRLFGL